MISVLVALVILGVAIYIIELIPMDATVKRVIHVLAILFVLLWVLQLLGVWPGFPRPLR